MKADVVVTLARVMTSAFLMAALAGCSSEDAAPVQSAADASTVTLSAAFGAQCARCHGPTGLGQSPNPRLPGNRDATAFVALVRAGRGDMPAFDASKISDEDLRADFEAMKSR